MTRPARPARPARAPLADAAWTLALTLAIVGPLWLGRGFWLVGDMVFVPHQPWKDAWLGLDGTLPRAVPMDALVSAASHLVPGQVLQRLLLTGGLLLGGLGVARLLAGRPWCARAAAVALFLWNPWVAERLGIGQWAILLGYLVLPWVALAARRLRADPSDWGPAAVAGVVAAVCSPSSGVMAAATLLVLGAMRRTWWRAVLVGVVANLTWAVPAVTASTAEVTTTGVFQGFAAHAESSAGVLASLLSLGGIWKTSIVLAARTSSAVVLLSCLLSLAAIAGLAAHGRRRGATAGGDDGRADGGGDGGDDGGDDAPRRADPTEARRLAVLGAAALLVAVLPDLPGGDAALEGLAAHVPGLALLRDSHRFLAPLGLVLAVGVGGAVAAVRERVRPGRESLWGVVGLLVVAPVVLLPGLAWGLHGDLQRSSYPPGWDVVAARIGAEPGTTVVLPWAGSYRAFRWAHDRAVLDPAPRYLPGDVLVDDRTYLLDRVVPAEDPRSESVRAALATSDPVAALRDLGVRWVLVEDGAQPGQARPGVAQLQAGGGRTAYAGDGLTLLDLGAGTGGALPVLATHRLLVLAGHACTIALLFSGAVWILRYRK